MRPSTSGDRSSPEIYTAYYQSPLGLLAVSASAAAILAVEYAAQAGAEVLRLPACLTECLDQLDQYFQGRRQEFALALAPAGTSFQRSVWDELQRIPYGATLSYRELATAVGNPAATRAAGRANGRNRINIIIPCHRVIGADGSLTGYGGGLWRKEWLLDHERRMAGKSG
jgi:methylated-DNA-[protein]-cysteine S-methyltransferase